MSSESTAPYWMLWDELVLGGAHWSGVVRRNAALRLTDIDGGANVAVMFFNYDDLSERYNMPDTLKAQHTAYLTQGHCLYSDMGRVLCSITADTSGWHDTICGFSNAADVRKRFGEARFDQHRNDYYRNGHDSFINELGKYGLDERDLTATVNFFSKVVVGDGGKLEFVRKHSQPGAYVDLRFEMNTLVVLSTCQHPLDPATRYLPCSVRLTAWNARPAPQNDPCRMRCPENQRGFINTERYAK
jgi:urea carboxylase-associated protein 2